MREPLLLLDGHSLAYRAFFALPAENFSTSTGQNTNAVYGFTSMLINVLRDEAPTHVGGGLRRLAGRPSGSASTPSTRPAARATPDRVLGPDPAAARGARRAADPLHRGRGLRGRRRHRHPDAPRRSSRGTEVVICSGDRDAFQLVADHVTLLYPVRGRLRGVADGPRPPSPRSTSCPPSATATSRRWSASPPTTSPGVPGVGPKTAAKWISQYGDLAGVVAHVDEIKGKAGESLRDHLDGVLRNRRLNQLVRRRRRCGCHVDDLERQTWDREEVHEVFDGLEFRVLRERLFQTFEAVKAEVESRASTSTATCCPRPRSPAWLGRARRAAGARRRHRRRPRGRGGTGDAARAGRRRRAPGAAAYLDLTALDPEQEDGLADWLADPSGPRCCTTPRGRRRPWPRAAGRWPG